MARKNEAEIGGRRQINNVTLNYPHLAEPDPQSSGTYGVQISKIDDENIAKLDEIGIPYKHGKDRIDREGNAKPTPEWGYYRTSRTKFEFGLFDSSGREIKGEAKEQLLKRIGPGTVANVTVKSGKDPKAPAVSCYLESIQIVDLVEGTSGITMDPVEGGFIAPIENPDDVPY